MAPKKSRQKVDLGTKDKVADAKLVCMLRDPIKCLEHPKIEIQENQRFFSITCTLRCQVSFHFGCWKVFKDDRKVKTEKEVLDLGCVTPDCRGIVNCVIVGKENGEKVEIKKETTTTELERKRHVSGCSGAAKCESGAKKRTESESETPKPAAQAVSSEAVQLKDLKFRLKQMGIELRDAKLKETKLSKENERLHTENSKLLSKTLQAEESVSHMTDAIFEAESQQENVKLEFQRNMRKMRSDYELMQQEVLKQRRNGELLEEHLQVCGNNHGGVADSEVLATKSKLIRTQVNHARDKAEIELVHSVDYINALKCLLQWFQPNKIALKSRKQGTWTEFRYHLQLHCEMYEAYKTDLETFVGKCEDSYNQMLAILQKTGKVGEFSIPIKIQRPRFSSVAFVEDLLLLLQENCTEQMLKMDCENTQMGRPFCSTEIPICPNERRQTGGSPTLAKLISQIQTAFPCLSVEDAEAYLIIVRTQNSNKLNGLAIPLIIRQIGKLMSEESSPTHLLDWFTNLEIDHDYLSSSSCNDECCICFEAMTSDTVTQLDPCGHIFHSECIRTWFKEKRDCPFCRNFSILNDEYPSVNNIGLANVF